MEQFSFAKKPSADEAWDTVIIGSGPSSLACAEVLLNNNITNFLILDKGQKERLEDNPHDIANGFSGASLFSDGKVSFYPSGTKVWDLSNEDLVEKGLKYVIELIRLLTNIGNVNPIIR